MAYQTLTVWGRGISEAEWTAIKDHAVINVNENKLPETSAVCINSDPENTYPANFAWSRTWQTEEDAVAWQTFINTFTPPPTSCTITEV